MNTQQAIARAKSTVNPIQYAIDVLNSVDEVITSPIHDAIMQARIDIREAVGALSHVRRIGMDHESLVSFRQKILDKIDGLQKSHYEFASKFVETGIEDHKNTAIRFKAEMVTLNEVLVELDRAQWEKRNEASTG